MSEAQHRRLLGLVRTIWRDLVDLPACLVDTPAEPTPLLQRGGDGVAPPSSQRPPPPPPPPPSPLLMGLESWLFGYDLVESDSRRFSAPSQNRSSNTNTNISSSNSGEGVWGVGHVAGRVPEATPEAHPEAAPEPHERSRWPSPPPHQAEPATSVALGGAPSCLAAWGHFAAAGESLWCDFIDTHVQ